MNKAGGGSLLIAGILVVIVGVLIQSAIIEWLLDVVGFILIAGGVIVGIYGLIKMFSGSKSGASDF